MTLADQYPDIAKGQINQGKALHQVGMNKIEVPLQVGSGADMRILPASVDAMVSLDAAQTKGIHMSRLYLIVQQQLPSGDLLSFEHVAKILGAFLESHSDLSRSAYLEVRVDLPLERSALLSAHKGWRVYPMSIGGELTPRGLRLKASLEVLYSSTCPCSAALARQLIQKNFAATFAKNAALDWNTLHEWLATESAILATPHGQRSSAKIDLEFIPTTKSFDPTKYIDAIEAALGTPVQAAVKREDEQEFARLNGSHLMFAEDAARRMQAALDPFEELSDFTVHATHFESLHPHDAVAVARKIS